MQHPRWSQKIEKQRAVLSTCKSDVSVRELLWRRVCGEVRSLRWRCAHKAEARRALTDVKRAPGVETREAMMSQSGSEAKQGGQWRSIIPSYTITNWANTGMYTVRDKLSSDRGYLGGDELKVLPQLFVNVLVKQGSSSGEYKRWMMVKWWKDIFTMTYQTSKHRLLIPFSSKCDSSCTKDQTPHRKVISSFICVTWVSPLPRPFKTVAACPDYIHSPAKSEHEHRLWLFIYCAEVLEWNNGLWPVTHFPIY